MKKIILLFGLLTVFTLQIFAKQIDENSAQQVGQNFMQTQTTSQTIKSGTTLQLVYTANSSAKSPNATIQATNYFYVFNRSTTGFVLVSGDDVVNPILGYSDEGTFDPNNLPPNIAKWLEGYKDQIRFAIQEKIEATEEIKNDWECLLNNRLNKASIKMGSVSPLIQTKWSQSPFVNDLCPYDVSAGSQNGYHCVTGCPATAMAQIMKFWNYPTTGTGFHSYNHEAYGTLSANFASTTYDWAIMPDYVTATNNSVATLMYDCGVAVEMGYGPLSSGSYVIISKSPTPQQCSEYAYKTYFGYDATSIQGKERVNYSDANWILLLKSELDAGRPIQYAGFGGGSGHTFVCDGYDNSDKFHMNWGWGGYADGYFLISSLNPGSGGTGSGTGTYNQGQQAVIGIKPPSGSGNQTYNLDITSDVSASSSNINYGAAFSISCNITNKGTNTFNGDYCSAVFDNNNNFVDYVSTITGTSLPGGYTYSSNLVFSSTGNFSFLPGAYNVYIFYRPTGGNWKQIHASGLFTWEHAAINFKNASSIEMYTDITPNPTTFVKGQPATVSLNLTNKSSTTFLGQFQVNLYSLDGLFVETIGTLNENSGLAYNYIYTNPLTFSSSSIAANPGTYILAVVFKSNTASSFSLVGSTNYQNPIKIIVADPPYLADNYEPNNNLNQSFSLPLTFSNNTAVKATLGSNCHVGDDFDYYKIVLPIGYKYTLNARLQDSYSSNNGQTYSLDAQFTYSTDATNWSESYDHVMPNNITINNGGTIYFFASPYFIGQTGSYLFDLSVTRAPYTGINETEISNGIKLYPNPAKDITNIDLRDFTRNVSQIKILNLQGQLVKMIDDPKNQEIIQIDLKDISDGIYFVQFLASDGIITKKLIHKE